jgi:hypothetical protein
MTTLKFLNSGMKMVGESRQLLDGFADPRLDPAQVVKLLHC